MPQNSSVLVFTLSLTQPDGQVIIEIRAESDAGLSLAESLFERAMNPELFSL